MKLAALPTTQQLRDIQMYGKPGGYDRYRCLKESVTDFVQHGVSASTIQGRIKSITSDSERETTANLFERCIEWTDKHTVSTFVTPRSIWHSPNKVFSVKVEPEIGAATNKDRYILSLYCHGTIRLAPTQAGIGILLMRSALAGKYDPADKLGILDIVAGKRFVAVLPSPKRSSRPKLRSWNERSRK